MNIDQIRDEVAEMMPEKWVRTTFPLSNGKTQVWWTKQSEIDKRGDDAEGTDAHPVPTTIDGIAALWPKGWGFEINCGNWWTDMTGGDNHVNAIMYQMIGYKHGEKYDDDNGPVIAIEPHPTEYEARLRLLHSVLTAERNTAVNAVADGERK